MSRGAAPGDGISQNLGESEVYLILAIASRRTDAFPSRGHIKPQRV